MSDYNPFRNILSIVLGRLGELLLSFFAVTLLIRYLGTSQYGIFTSSIALITIFSKFIDLGFSQIIFREYSSNSKNIYINSAISLRFIILLIFILFFNIYAQLFNIDLEETLISNILFINVIFASRFRNIRDLLEIPFKARLRMDVVMICTFLDNFLLLSLILTASLLKVNLITVTLLYTLANLPGFLFLIISLYKKTNFVFRFKLMNIRWLVTESLPLWGTGLLLALFMQLDVILIKNFVSNHAAGLFSAAVRVGIPLAVIPLSIITTVFPVIVKKKKLNSELTQGIINFSFKILILLIIFSSVFISFKSKEILNLLYGPEFVSASSTLHLIIWSFALYYINQLTQNLTTVIGKQKINFYYSLILIIVYLTLLIVSLEKYGILGAGFARLGGVIAGFIFFYFSFNRSEFKMDLFSSKSTIFYIFFLSGAFLFSQLNFLYYALILPTFTILIILLTGFFDYTDFQFFFKFLNEPKWMKRFIDKKVI